MIESTTHSNLEVLWSLVRSIPSGKCTSYGRLGQALPRPVSGYIVGRWMSQSPPDVPWWRVVSKNGNLPIGKLDPNKSSEQQKLLEQEGVPFQGGQVKMDACLYELP